MLDIAVYLLTVLETFSRLSVGWASAIALSMGSCIQYVATFVGYLICCILPHLVPQFAVCCCMCPEMICSLLHMVPKLVAVRGNIIKTIVFAAL